MRTWGDGYGYALVATGRAEAMVDPSAAPYDVAPMPVILAEAGGRFSDWSGASRIDGGNGLATNGTSTTKCSPCSAGLQPAGLLEACGTAR